MYPHVGSAKSDIGVSGLLNDQAFNLVPEGINRLNRRQKYNTDPGHTSLKDKREKRDE